MGKPASINLRDRPSLRPAVRGWLIVALAGCAPSGAAAPGGTPAPAGDGVVYRCEQNFRFSVRFQHDSAIVHLDGRESALPSAISASGARYSDGEVTYWGRGREALLETPAALYRSCVGHPVESAAEMTRILAGGSPEGPSLEGTHWGLMSAAGLPALAGISDALPSLDLGERGTVSGSTGCNRLTGRYQEEDPRLSFGDALATTRRACPEPGLMEQEQRFLQALHGTETYYLWGDVLTLLRGEAVLARFTVVD